MGEATLGVDPNYQRQNDGTPPPIIHVDSDLPLHSDRDGALITAQAWGIYYKPDFDFGGVHGGSTPEKLTDPHKVKGHPSSPKSPAFTVGDSLRNLFCSALSFWH